VAGELFQVSRGQLFDSEETLAKECGTTRKVVRRVLDLLEKFGLIEVEKGHRQGRHPLRVTVRDYEVSQRIRGERASDRANKGARTSPTKGPKETEENETNETNCDALVEKIGSTWAAEMRGLGQPSGEIKQRLAGVRAEREGDSLRLLVATSYGRDYLEQFHVQLAAAARKALGEAVTLEIVAPMTGDGR
jgi:hypothetical protein